MKPEYDFSQAQKGKFYNPNAKFKLPIYLESDVHDFMTKLAEEKDIDISVLVNQWLRNNINLIKSISDKNSIAFLLKYKQALIM